MATQYVIRVWGNDFIKSATLIPFEVFDENSLEQLIDTDLCFNVQVIQDAIPGYDLNGLVVEADENILTELHQMQERTPHLV